MNCKEMTTRGILAVVLVVLLAPPAFAQENKIDAWLAAGVQQYNAGQLQQASEYFAAVLQQDPEHPYANYYLGAIYFKANKPAQAVSYLEKAAAAEPKIEGVEAFLANVYVQAKMPEKALPYYQEQYDANPGNGDIALQYGKLLKEIGQEDEALVVLQAIVGSGGIQANGAQFYQGVIYYGRGMYSRAVSYFEQVAADSAYGDAARQYIDALKAAQRPLNLYASLDYFYNDNPESDGVELVPGQIFAGGARGSQGVTPIFSVNSRTVELGDHWKARLGYLYYGIYHFEDFAEQFDFAGHYIKPHFEYVISKEKKVNFDFQYAAIDFNDQDLNDSYSLDVKYDRSLNDGDSWYLLAGVQLDQFVDDYRSSPSALPDSLEYKDATFWKIGGGMVVNAPQKAHTITLSGTYRECLPANEDDVALAAKARDYRHREALFGAQMLIPFQSIKELSFTASFNFSYKDHVNVQTGDLYSSAIGKDINVVNLKFGGKFSYLLNKKYGLRLTGGVDRTDSESEADELNSVSNRYFLQIAGSY